jgi:hypothetical protein
MNRMLRGVLAAALLAACARDPKITIQSPTEGEMLTGSSVRVVVATEGVTIAPVADQRPGAAHLHLLLDVDPPPAGAAVPVGVAGITHLGGGQTEFTLDSVAPGTHRLIVLLGDNAHVVLARQQVDTVTFMVH